MQWAPGMELAVPPASTELATESRLPRNKQAGHGKALNGLHQDKEGGANSGTSPRADEHRSRESPVTG